MILLPGSSGCVDQAFATVRPDCAGVDTVLFPFLECRRPAGLGRWNHAPPPPGTNNSNALESPEKYQISFFDSLM
jgi:hypothetical protein